MELDSSSARRERRQARASSLRFAAKKVAARSRLLHTNEAPNTGEEAAHDGVACLGYKLRLRLDAGELAGGVHVEFDNFSHAAVHTPRKARAQVRPRVSVEQFTDL